MEFTGFKKVLVIESRVDMRTAIREALKAIGVPKTIVSSDVKEALGVLEVEDPVPDWIIANVEVDPNSKSNIYHLARILLEDQYLSKTRLSALVSEDYLSHIPALFEMGILSYHKKPLTKQSIQAEFESLFASLSKDWFEHALTSAGYLREYLAENEMFAELQKLENSLYRQFPHKGELLLKVAEAQYMSEDEEGMKQTLALGSLLGDKFEVGVRQLADLVGGMDSEVKVSLSQNLGIKTVVLVDQDSIITTQVAETLKANGAEVVHEFHDGEVAYEFLKKNTDVDLIVHEWKLPKISGHQLLQRIAGIKGIRAPVVIASSLLKEDDLLLLREMGVAQLIQKPFGNDVLLGEIINIGKNEKYPSDAKSVLRQLINAANKDDAKKAQELNSKLQAMKPPEHVLLSAAAHVAFAKKDFLTARDKAMESFRMRGEEINTLNLLGKAFLKLGDNLSASKCFNRAQQMNPKNLERLCNLAEANANIGDMDNAEDAIAGAKNIDANSQQVGAAEAKVAINKGDTKRAKEALTKLESLQSVLTYMNNRGVYLAKDGKIDESIALYKTAADSLPNQNSHEAAIIFYNLGLACIRKNDLKDAIRFLEVVKEANSPEVFKKANSLKKRAQVALKENKKVELRTASSDGGVGDFDAPLAIQGDIGEYCLHMIFDCGALKAEGVKKLLANPPKFKPQVKKMAG